jgi:hypothetical protein
VGAGDLRGFPAGFSQTPLVAGLPLIAPESSAIEAGQRDLRLGCSRNT